MRYSLVIFYAICFLPAISFSQKKAARDTSFTLHSAWVKELPRYPFIRLASVELAPNITVQRDVVYRSVGSRKLRADVFFSQKKTPGKPGVLLLHGGGWKSGDKSHCAAMAQALANAGYVAVAIEYTLSTEAIFPASLHDVKEAIRWMRACSKEFGIDQDRIAVLGTSAGGQLAALAGATNSKEQFEGSGDFMKYSSHVQAVIDIDGILAFRHPESEEGAVAAEWLGGTYEEQPGNWRDASPLEHAGCHFPPLLFINSSHPRFHAGRDDLIDQLKPCSVYTEVHTIPQTPHTFWLFDPWFDQTINTILSFLKKVF